MNLGEARTFAQRVLLPCGPTQVRPLRAPERKAYMHLILWSAHEHDGWAVVRSGHLAQQAGVPGEVLARMLRRFERFGLVEMRSDGGTLKVRTPAPAAPGGSP